MEDLKTKYNQVLEERKELIQEINRLRNNEVIKRYFRLRNKNKDLINQQKKLYTQIKNEEYASCDHIWVNTLHDYDNFEGRTYNYYGCVKCGLDKRVFHIIRQLHNPNMLSFEQKIMYDYLYNGTMHGTKTEIYCDLDMAKAIYAKIKEAHPDIDDETAIRYLQVAVHNMRTIKVNDERKAGRIRRLSLELDNNK